MSLSPRLGIGTLQGMESSQRSFGNLSLLCLCAVVLTLTFLVGSRLRWSETPGFMFQESYGLGYNHAVQLGDLCDPSPFAGLQRQTSNVTDQRCFSLAYAVPNKLLREQIDLYSLHRIMGVLFYGVTLLFLAYLGRRLGFSLVTTLLLVVHWGLSAQFLSYLLEAKLTLLSVVWLAATLLLLASLDRRAREGRRGVVTLMFLLPIVCCSSYETYAVARPIAVALMISALGWILLAQYFRGHRAKLFLAFFAGLLLGAGLLKYSHPQMRFDQTLFEGRTESLVTPDGNLYSGWSSTIPERVSELPLLLKLPHYYFSSETKSEMGWLDVILLLGAVSLVGFISIVRDRRSEAARYLLDRKWIILLLLGVVVTSLVVPLLSITYMRGHRLFGFYLATLLLASIGFQALLLGTARWRKSLLGLLALVIVSWTMLHRIPLVMAWQPEKHHTPMYAWDLLSTLSALELPADYQAKPRSVEVLVCDKKEPPDWEHWWNSALYVSGFGCRASGMRTVLSCDCEPLRDSAGNVMRLCLTRRVIEGHQAIVLAH